ncbi:AAR2 protein, putative [Plasmodium gallinaceum]|uniref:AAR2 protein, putative n=1 Tax=Plasmodium gallinaceum TaxID=5849 RepID=A0A1J1GY01_PLAGA|nr:AAR2 protein, putative [Plasmodium gallinaceum]CRG97442.1 AAR2 protein, putative [Plasmodium gallinaceum]
MAENICIESRNEKKDYENFIYNDKCSLVLLIDDKNKGKEEFDESKTVMNDISILNKIDKANKSNDEMKKKLNELNNNNNDIYKNNSKLNINNDELCQNSFKLDKNKVDKDKKDEKLFKGCIKLYVGFDYSTFELDTRYKVIKFINKGSHFLHWNNDVLYDHNNKLTKEFKMNEMKKNNCEEIRNSRFIYFDDKKKLLVLKYDIKDNNFKYIREDDNIYKYFYNLHEKDFLDDYILREEKNSILIYPYTYSKVWVSLTNYINDEIINKIEPVNKTFCSSFLKDDKDTNNLDKEEEVNLYSQPYMFYSVIPKYPSHLSYHKKKQKKENPNVEEEKKEHNIEDDDNIKQEEDNLKCVDTNKSFFEYLSIENENMKYTPSYLTMINMDKFWIIKEIVEQEYTYICYNNEKVKGFTKYENKFFYILGEFQFSFVLFHLGFNYQSFLQWKKLFELFCNSQQLITEFKDFYEEVLKVISVHLNYLSDDFFDNTENSFILFGIYNIYEIINNLENVEENIKNLLNTIDSNIYNKIGLHLPDLSFVYEEFQPTYVDED